MESRVHQIRLKLNAYAANLDNNIIRVIESKPVSDKLIILNQQQLLRNRDVDGSLLRHESTGKTTLTKAYAKITGKKRPNLFETGLHFDGIALSVFSMAEYSMFFKPSLSPGAAFYGKFLSRNYGGNIYGIAKKDSPKAQRITHKAIGQDLKIKVFKR